VSRPGRIRQVKGRPRAPFFVLGALAAGILAGPAAPQEPRPRSWPEERCARYAEAWSEALARFGRDGLGEAFLDRHRRFLEAGCTGPRNVCPRSPAELALADSMTVAAMNIGAASSFAPFACRD
jgi:hypothetical protein